jgi:four helix bundle protein
LSIAKGSCGEVRTQLQIAYELNYLFKDEFVVLKQKCESTSRQLSGFMKYLNSYKGNKK